jgi:uncharacterized protein YqfA (UPF0365 family)
MLVRQLVSAGFQFVHREEDLIVRYVVEDVQDIVELHVIFVPFCVLVAQTGIHVASCFAASVMLG